MNTTPVKRNLKGSFYSPPPKKPNWTPSKPKGKSEDVSGYVLLVGQEVLSRSNNKYFDMIIQCAKAVIRRVRVMVIEEVKQGDFLDLLTEEKSKTQVQFKTVFETDGFYFFNSVNGSSYSFTNKSLGFHRSNFSNFTTKLKDVMNAVTEEIDLHCQISYIGLIKHNPQNGSPYRNVVFYDVPAEGEPVVFFGTIWNEDMFNLSENVKMYITNLKVKDYFGVLLYTTSRTLTMHSGSESVKPLTREQLVPFHVRAANVQNPAEVSAKCLIGAQFKSVLTCPTKNCDGNIIPPADGNGTIGGCNTCLKRVNINVVKNLLTGEIDIEDQTLTVDRDCIDVTFGNGVSDMYRDKPIELADKFLGLTDVKVMFEKKTKKAILLQYA